MSMILCMLIILFTIVGLGIVMFTISGSVYGLSKVKELEYKTQCYKEEMERW